MGSLYLVRHGQASFGAANYDQLSDLGRRQCVRLGEYFAERGKRFDAVFTGTLTRQIQSWEGIAHGMAQAAVNAPAPPVATQLPALNEYDSAAVIAAVHPEPLARSVNPEAYRHHMRVLRQGYAGNVLLVSSGGPIANAIAQVLGAPKVAAIDLNLRMHNSAVTEFAFTPKRHMLQSFNSLPHLDHPAWLDTITFM